MALGVSSKDVTLHEIECVINSLGSLAESILDPNALALIVSNSGDVTFTNNGWKVLKETRSSSPIAKLITDTAKNYTNCCGEDCKNLLFTLKEFMHIICRSIEKDSAFTRIELIQGISSIKRLLSSIFVDIRSSQEVHLTGPLSFSHDLRTIVSNFMSSRFSIPVAEILSSLICDFVNGVQFGTCSIQSILGFVVSHFDCFCSKVYDHVSESQVIEGFVICKKSSMSNFKVEDSKFIIVYDLSLKPANDVALEINKESFLENMNLTELYEQMFKHFENFDIKLILTPSIVNPSIDLFCRANGIYILDRLENEEIELIISCVKISPLESLMDPVGAENLGAISTVKIYNHLNSCLINIQCSNPVRLLRIHHILLAAPFEPLWKEYYFECLNCLKTIEKWVSDASFKTSGTQTGCYNSVCVNSKSISLSDGCDSTGNHMQNIKFELDDKFPNKAFQSATYQEVNRSYDCNYVLHQNLGKASLIDSNSFFGVSLPPVKWELLFLTSLEKRSEKMDLPVKSLAQKLCYVISKLICRKMSIPFCSVKNMEDAYAAFSTKCGDKTYLEPVVSKEIYLYSVLDLMCQVLKIEKILSAK